MADETRGKGGVLPDEKKLLELAKAQNNAGKSTKQSTKSTKENTKENKKNTKSLKEKNQQLKENVKNLKELVTSQSKQLSALRKSIKTQQKNIKQLKDNNKTLINWNRNTRNISTSLSVLRSKLLLVSFGYGLTLQKVRQLVDLFAEQEAAEAQVAQSLASTGNASLQTSESIQVMASELQKATGVGDEMILRSSALLTTFTNISGNTFPETQKAIVDVTAAMFQGNVTMEGLKTTTIQVGKALNDPVKGISALSRVGIQFTKSQKETIKEFVKTNQLAKAQGVILKELNRQFGGVASLDTYEKSSRSLSAAIGDLGEEFGESLRPSIEALNETLLKLVESLNPSIIIKNTIAASTMLVTYAGLNKLLRTFTGVTLFRLAKGGTSVTKRLVAMTKSAGGFSKLITGPVFTKSLGNILKLSKGFSVIAIASTAGFFAIRKLIDVFSGGEKPTKDLTEEIAKFTKETNNLTPEEQTKKLKNLTAEIDAIQFSLDSMGTAPNLDLIDIEAQKKLEEYVKTVREAGHKGFIDEESRLGTLRRKLQKERQQQLNEERESLKETLILKNEELKVVRTNIKARESNDLKRRNELLQQNTESFVKLNKEKNKELRSLKATNPLEKEKIKLGLDDLKLSDEEQTVVDGLISSYLNYTEQINSFNKVKKTQTDLDTQILNIEKNIALLDSTKSELDKEKIKIGFASLTLTKAEKEELEAKLKTLIELRKEEEEAIKNSKTSDIDFDQIEKDFNKFMAPDDKSLSTEELIKRRFKEAAESITDIENLSAEQLKALETKISEDTTLERKIEKYQSYADGVQEIFGSLSNFLQRDIDNRMEALDKESDREVDRVKQTSEYKLAQLRGDNQKMKDLEEEARKKNLAKRKKLFRQEKALAISEIIIDFVQAQASEFSGGIFKGLTAAPFLLAAKAAAIATVASQKMPEFAQGGDFITSGRQAIVVGDNPGGQERVQITPLSSPNISNTNAAQGNLSIVINNPIMTPDYTEDVIIPQIEDALRRGAGTGILA